MSMFIKLTQNSYVNMSYEEEKRLNKKTSDNELERPHLTKQ